VTEDQELVFGAAGDPGGVFAALSGEFTVRTDAPTAARWTWLDTPDWRLLRRGMALREVRQGRSRDLVLEIAGSELRGPTGRASWPGRADQLPGSPVLKRIRDVVGSRAIVPLAEVEVRVIRLRLLDPIAKTRVTGELAQHRLLTPRRAPLPLRVRLAPLRGYGADARRAAEVLRAAMPVDGSGSTARDHALAAAGHHAGRSAGDDVADLDPDGAAGRAIATVLLRQLDVIMVNRDAAATGIDGESLHDVRSAALATRAALHLVGDVLPSDLTTRFGGQFDWLGDTTSRPRDLDVCLAVVDGRLGVDTAAVPALGTVREAVIRRRRSAFQRLAAELHSERADELLNSWRTVLEQIVLADPPGPPIKDIVAARVRAAHRSLVKLGRRVTGEHTERGGLSGAPSAELHAIRRSGKELRYLLEGTRTLCVPDVYADLYRDLKALHDALGAVQDAALVDAELRAVSIGLLRGRSRTALDAVLAAGALGDRVRARETEVRAVLTGAFAALDSPRAAERVAVLVDRR
jgi:CHAD domain-containing protein